LEAQLEKQKQEIEKRFKSVEKASKRDPSPKVEFKDPVDDEPSQKFKVTRNPSPVASKQPRIEKALVNDPNEEHYVPLPNQLERRSPKPFIPINPTAQPTESDLYYPRPSLNVGKHARNHAYQLGLKAENAYLLARNDYLQERAFDTAMRRGK
jgi:hypothetical protein